MEIAGLFSLLGSCIASRSLKKGRCLHQKAFILGLQNDVGLSKNLIKLYISCKDFISARLVFQNTENPFDITFWNFLLAAYSKNFLFTEVIGIFGRLLEYGCLKANDYTYPSVLKACGALKSVRNGEMLHANLLKSGIWSDVVVASAIVGMYAKCDLFSAAIRLFNEMPGKDVPSWNSVISCYFQSGQYERALEMFKNMDEFGLKHDSVTYTSAIASCSRLLDLDTGERIHKQLIRSRFSLDDFTSSALVDMYGKCGRLDKAVEVFEQVKEKSLVSWNSIIAGHSLRGDSKSCIELFMRMLNENIKPSTTTLSSLLMACSKSAQLLHGKFVHGYLIRNYCESDMYVDCSLIDLYFKCRDVALAERVFSKLSKARTVVWNVMISGYVSVGNYFQALGTFNEMKLAEVAPDAITLTSVLSSCTQLGALEQGKEVHKIATKGKMETNEILMGALLDMYAKCGAFDEALSVFNNLPKRDLVSWTSMIEAYGYHGQAYEATKLFEKMLQSGIKPDRVTFLAIISACSHAGMVNEGLHFFSLMLNVYKIRPNVEEYSCFIDLLGRSGRLREGYDILKSTPSIAEDTGLLSTLFAGCLTFGDQKLGEEIADLLMEAVLIDTSTYILLANLYASLRKWDKASKVRMKMKDLGITKNPAYSWIQIGESMYAFSVGDKIFPQAEKTYECLSMVRSHMENELPCC